MPNNQLVGNIGLYYIAYELSKDGWNVLLTSRNAKGVDIVIYNQKATKMHTIQVKALSRRSVPVPLGKKLDTLIAKYIIICSDIKSCIDKKRERPEVFVAKVREIKGKIHRGKKNGKVSYWLQPVAYTPFRDKWDKIGLGF